MDLDVACLSLDALDVGEQAGNEECSVERDHRETAMLAVGFCGTARATELSGLLEDRRFSVGETREAIGMLELLLASSDDRNDHFYGGMALEVLREWLAH